MSYRNKFEEQTALALKANKVPFSYEDTKIPYTVSGTYLVDFRMTSRRGDIIYIETKGNGRSFDHVSRRKLIAVKEQHPEISLKILFYSDGAIGPKRKDGTRMHQSDWAIKHGFDYAIRDVPMEWYE